MITSPPVVWLYNQVLYLLILLGNIHFSSQFLVVKFSSQYKLILSTSFELRVGPDLIFLVLVHVWASRLLCTNSAPSCLLYHSTILHLLKSFATPAVAPNTCNIRLHKQAWAKFRTAHEIRLYSDFHRPSSTLIFLYIILILIQF